MKSHCPTQASVGGRVKDDASKKTIASGMGDVSDAALMDLESGAFKAKKARKEKSPEELAMAELKTLEKKILAYYHMICLLSPK